MSKAGGDLVGVLMIKGKRTKRRTKMPPQQRRTQDAERRWQSENVMREIEALQVLQQMLDTSRETLRALRRTRKTLQPRP